MPTCNARHARYIASVGALVAALAAVQNAFGRDLLREISELIPHSDSSGLDSIHRPLRGPLESRDILVRPRAWAMLKTTDPGATLEKLSSIAKEAGFEISRIDKSQGEFEAARKNTDQLHQILIWLERDYNQPLRISKLHIHYTKSTVVMGTVTSARLTAIDPSDDIQALLEVFRKAEE